MDPITLDIVVKAGFAGLCCWLVWDTRKESRDRETRMSTALEKANSELSAGNQRAALAMEAVATAMNRMSDVLQDKTSVANHNEFKSIAEKCNAEIINKG